MKLGGLRGHVERKRPLFQKWIEGQFGSRRDDVNFAAEIDQAELVQRNGGGAELFFDEVHGAFYFAGGDMIFGEALQRAHGDEIEEAVKTLAPAGFGANQAEPFPVAQTVRLNT